MEPKKKLSPPPPKKKKKIKNNTEGVLRKPITDSIEEARLLDRIAKENNVLLQIGHLERFNPAILKLKEIYNQELQSSQYKLELKFVLT